MSRCRKYIHESLIDLREIGSTLSGIGDLFWVWTVLEMNMLVQGVQPVCQHKYLFCGVYQYLIPIVDEK